MIFGGPHMFVLIGISSSRTLVVVKGAACHLLVARFGRATADPLCPAPGRVARAFTPLRFAQKGLPYDFTWEVFLSWLRGPTSAILWLRTFRGVRGHRFKKKRPGPYLER